MKFILFIIFSVFHIACHAQDVMKIIYQGKSYDRQVRTILLSCDSNYLITNENKSIGSYQYYKSKRLFLCSEYKKISQFVMSYKNFSPNYDNEGSYGSFKIDIETNAIIISFYLNSNKESVVFFQSFLEFINVNKIHNKPLENDLKVFINNYTN